jgi:uncharacterized membrane protein YccF (DUF307 family)
MLGAVGGFDRTLGFIYATSVVAAILIVTTTILTAATLLSLLLLLQPLPLRPLMPGHND